jgi:flagellar protein FliS
MAKGGEIARNLDRLYKHMLVRLLDVDFKNDASAVDEVIKNLRPLRESWAKLAQGQKQEAAGQSSTAAAQPPQQPTDAVV